MADKGLQRESAGISRRSFLAMCGGVGGVTALLSGCQSAAVESTNQTNDASHAATVDAIVTCPSHPEIVDPDMAPPVPMHPLPPPVVGKEPSRTYGILPRSMWTNEPPDMARIRPMDGIGMITFHHSGDPIPFWATDFGETAQHLESVRAFHRKERFQDIGYHFAIDRIGRVWQLRSLMYQGEHVRRNNEHNLGVVVLGNFDLQPMMQAQQEKVKIFGRLLRKKYGLPISKVHTHQEIVSTRCPGRNMQPFMEMVRSRGLI